MNLKVRCWVKMISNKKRSKTQLQVQKLKIHTHKMTMRICKIVWELVDYTSNTGVAACARGEEYGLKGINRKISERGIFPEPVLIMNKG